VLVAVLGAVVYQVRQTGLSREHVAALEKEASAARAREQRLREERNELVRRLAPAPAANGPTLPAPKVAAVASDRAALVKQLLATKPERWIPELALLTEEDWLRAAEQDRWETEYHQREAFSTLRQRAKAKFVRQLQAAAKAQGGPFPAELSQLLPYFDPPIDPAILQRYEILPLGPDADPKATFSIRERGQAQVDDEFDTQFSFTSDGYIVREGDNRTKKAFYAALQGFAVPNTGSLPDSFELLAPYLAPGSDQALARDWFQKIVPELRKRMKLPSAPETPR
jgi:hypothetical protein